MEISIEARKNQSLMIVKALSKKVSDMDSENCIREVYNSAISDVTDAINVYIAKNPQHSSVLAALKKEINSWMPLI